MDHHHANHLQADHSAHLSHIQDAHNPQMFESSSRSASNMVHHMMSMSFHGGYNETILFKEWTTTSCSGMIWSCLLIFIMACLYEGLKYYREYLFWKSYNKLQYRAVSLPADKNLQTDGNAVHMVGGVIHKQPPSICSWVHLFQSALHLLQVSLSFILMLVFMTYNVLLCLAVVFGAALGFFLFGWKKSVFVDVTEHCH